MLGPGWHRHAVRDDTRIPRILRIRHDDTRRIAGGGASPILSTVAQALCGRIIEPHFSIGVVSSVSFVSTTNTASSFARFVLLALALTTWRSPGSSEKLCPAW